MDARPGGQFPDRPNPENSMVSLRLDRLSFVAHHEYWARDCHFKMPMLMNRRLTKKFVEWHNVEELALPSRDRPAL